MWKYIRKYLLFAIIAGLFMIGEVMMDLVQPGFMSRIVDDGVLGVNNGGRADVHLIWMLGLQMIGLVLVGGLCGSLNNVFVHISSQNIGNEIRKDCFRRIMDFSFPQMDRFGTGSLVTRVTNDITQVQNFVSLFVRGADPDHTSHLRKHVFHVSAECWLRAYRNVRFPVSGGCDRVVPVEGKSLVFQAAGASGCHQ